MLINGEKDENTAITKQQKKNETRCENREL